MVKVCRCAYTCPLQRDPTALCNNMVLCRGNTVLFPRNKPLLVLCLTELHLMIESPAKTISFLIINYFLNNKENISV